MTKTITFNELRKIKDNLPDGSIHKIASELGIPVETVRNYFGGANFKKEQAVAYTLNRDLTEALLNWVIPPYLRWLCLF